MFNILFSDTRPVSSADWNGKLRYDSTKPSIMFLRLAKNNIKYMEHCQKAYHVSQVYTRMFKRKEAEVRKYFNSSELVQQFENIDTFYSTSAVISLISPVWGAKVKEIEDYIEKMPDAAKSSRLKDNKNLLEKYFNLEDIEENKEDKKMMKKVESLKELAAKNEKTIDLISMPYYNEDEPSQYSKELIAILKKVVAF
jgi:hypothetical protein